MLPASFGRTDSMESPELQRLRAAIIRDPGNAELRYLLGAELAQRREYPEAVAQMRTALDIDPKLQVFRVGVCTEKKKLKSPVVKAFWESISAEA